MAECGETSRQSAVLDGRSPFPGKWFHSLGNGNLCQVRCQRVEENEGERATDEKQSRKYRKECNGGTARELENKVFNL